MPTAVEWFLLAVALLAVGYAIHNDKDRGDKRK
jgi:hypothetical protein